MAELCLIVIKITDEILLGAIDQELVNYKHFASRLLKPMNRGIENKFDLKRKGNILVTTQLNSLIYYRKEPISCPQSIRIKWLTSLLLP